MSRARAGAAGLMTHRGGTMAYLLGIIWFQWKLPNKLQRKFRRTCEITNKQKRLRSMITTSAVMQTVSQQSCRCDVDSWKCPWSQLCRHSSGWYYIGVTDMLCWIPDSFQRNNQRIFGSLKHDWQEFETAVAMDYSNHRTLIRMYSRLETWTRPHPRPKCWLINLCLLLFIPSYIINAIILQYTAMLKQNGWYFLASVFRAKLLTKMTSVSYPVQQFHGPSFNNSITLELQLIIGWQT